MLKTLNDLDSLKFFDYTTEKPIRVYGTYNSPLFVAKDIATILDYSNTRKAIRDNVDIEDRFILESTRGTESSPYVIHPQTILINESGLYSLMLKSRKPEAKKFKRWITSTVIPTLRKNGEYSMGREGVERNKEQQKIDFNNVIESTIKLFERLGGMDDRDIILMRDLIKSNVIGDSGRIDELNTENTEWSCSRRLSEHFGINNSKEHRKLSRFGRCLSRAYQLKNNGDKPPQRLQYVQGTSRLVNHYFLSDWTEFGDEIMKTFFNLNLDSDSDSDSDSSN